MKEKRKDLEYFGFFLLLILYIAAAVIMPRVSRSGEILAVFPPLPTSALSAWSSSTENRDLSFRWSR